MRIALPFATLLSALLAQAIPDAGSPPAPAVAAADAGASDAGVAPPTAQIGFPADAGAPVQTAPALLPPRPLPPIPAGLGRVSGRITLSGPPPASRAATVVGQAPPPGTPGGQPLAPGFQPLGSTGPSTHDIRVCGVTQPDLSLQLGLGGGVLETLLWAVDGPPPAKNLKTRVKVSIEGCRFIPHVVATSVGAALSLVNGDALYHNVTGSGVDTFSLALVLKDHELPIKLKKAGLLLLESKNHSWMKGYVQVLPTSAFVQTDTDGSYFLDLPPGKHTIKLWHERLGEREEAIEISAGETTLKDFALSPK